MDVFLFAISSFATAVHYYRKNSNEKDPNYSALLNRTSLNATEYICLVTENNDVLPTGGLRADMRLNNLWHRATYVLEHHVSEHIGDFSSDGMDWNEMYVLVQKRSTLKDYCPGKLDPTPGGVVGFGESYEENALREMQEEMGINGATIDRLFTFPYQDERVRVWGAFFECTYTGPLKDLRLQEEEVECVMRMSLSELRDHIELHPEEFMPDACHAMKLYFQFNADKQVNRRLILRKGCSSISLENYGLRPRPSVLFFDCDDCLYFDDWVTARQLTDKIESWCVNQCGLQPGQAYELYKQYGTALRGLLAEGYIEDNAASIDEFLQAVHDIPIYSLLKKDSRLRDMLARIDPSIPKYIFTASVADHARRCLEALGIESFFVDIIDCKKCDLETKHSHHSFQRAMEIAGVENPEECLFFDDNLRNIRAGCEIGWRCVLVGRIGRDHGRQVSSEHAELEVDSIYDVEDVLSELFVKQ